MLLPRCSEAENFALFTIPMLLLHAELMAVLFSASLLSFVLY